MNLDRNLQEKFNNNFKTLTKKNKEWSLLIISANRTISFSKTYKSDILQ